jgi:hypothetical protein
MKLTMPMYQFCPRGRQEEIRHPLVSRGDRGNKKMTTAFSGGHREVHGISGTADFDRGIVATFPTGRSEREVMSMRAMHPHGTSEVS